VTSPVSGERLTGLRAAVAVASPPPRWLTVLVADTPSTPSRAPAEPPRDRRSPRHAC